MSRYTKYEHNNPMGKIVKYWMEREANTIQIVDGKLDVLFANTANGIPSIGATGTTELTKTELIQELASVDTNLAQLVANI